jgi:fluoroquinolone transport system permease protein
MRKILLSFKLMLIYIRNDMMLFAVCFVPLLCGLTFKFGVPAIEQVLTNYFSVSEILVPYYELFDLLLSVIPSTMFCFAAAMVILEEVDEHISGYFAITPLGKHGYLIARLGIPTIISFVITLILLEIFGLTTMNMGILIFTALSGSIQGLIIALLIVSFSTNKLEGMAVTKLSSLMIVGICLPFFIKNNAIYILSPLPTFWMAKAVRHNSLTSVLLTLLISLLWFYKLMKKFDRKI